MVENGKMDVRWYVGWKYFGPQKEDFEQNGSMVKMDTCKMNADCRKQKTVSGHFLWFRKRICPGKRGCIVTQNIRCW